MVPAILPVIAQWLASAQDGSERELAPRPAGKGLTDHVWPPSFVTAATPAVRSFTPWASLVPMAVQVCAPAAPAQESIVIDSPLPIG